MCLSISDTLRHNPSVSAATHTLSPISLMARPPLHHNASSPFWPRLWGKASSPLRLRPQGDASSPFQPVPRGDASFPFWPGPWGDASSPFRPRPRGATATMQATTSHAAGMASSSNHLAHGWGLFVPWDPTFNCLASQSSRALQSAIISCTYLCF
jgi:hypothetical protein